jgi:hypothetical protein
MQVKDERSIASGNVEVKSALGEGAVQVYSQVGH